MLQYLLGQWLGKKIGKLLYPSANLKLRRCTQCGEETTAIVTPEDKDAVCAICWLERNKEEKSGSG
jgi:hypothetical protein